MFPLRDVKEHGLLKERMTAMREGRTRVRHWTKGVRERESFLSFRDYIECFFLLFLFRIWNQRGRKRRCMAIDGRIEPRGVFF